MHVKSYGGGGYIGPNGGHVSPTNIVSTSTHHVEVWLKTETGKEIQLKLENFKIGIRKEHTIKAVCYDRENRRKLYHWHQEPNIT
jgi:hypothetical protein